MGQSVIRGILAHDRKENINPLCSQELDSSSKPFKKRITTGTPKGSLNILETAKLSLQVKDHFGGFSVIWGMLLGLPDAELSFNVSCFLFHVLESKNH